MINRVFIEKRSLFVVILAPFFFILLLYGNSNGLFRNHYDDAYITYRYAANLALGKGLIFNEGEKTDAASSPLFTLILSLFYKAGLTNLELISVSINILSAAGICLMVYKSILFLTKKYLLATFLAFLLGLHGFISGWAISGMETIFFTFLITAFIYQYYFQVKKNTFIFAITMVCILLTRMEAIILLAVWILSEAFKTFISQETKKRVFFTQAMVFLSVTLLYYSFHFLYYGYFISDAFQFKKIATYYQPNPSQLLLAWTGTSFFIVILATYSLLLKKSKSLKSLYIFIFISFLSLIYGPHSDGARYSVHLLPSLVILSSISLNNLIRSDRKKILGIFFLFMIFMQAFISALFVRSYMLGLVQGQICRKQIGKFLTQNVKPYEYILSGDIGMIAYQASDIKFIDAGGLTSKDVLDRFIAKRDIDDIILSKKPRYLADSFFVNQDGKLLHKGLTNQIEYIKGVNVYSNLFSKDVFQNIVYRCLDNKRSYAIIDLQSLYNK